MYKLQNNDFICGEPFLYKEEERQQLVDLLKYQNELFGQRGKEIESVLVRDAIEELHNNARQRAGIRTIPLMCEIMDMFEPSAME